MEMDNLLHKTSYLHYNIISLQGTMCIISLWMQTLILQPPPNPPNKKPPKKTAFPHTEWDCNTDIQIE